MQSSQKIVLRRDLLVTVVFVVAFVLVISCVCFAWYQHAAADRAAADLEKRFGRLRGELADLVRHSGQVEIEEWANRRCTTPYVALLAVFDAQAQPMVVAAADADVRRQLRELWLQRPERFAGIVRIRPADGGVLDIAYRRGPVPGLFTSGFSGTLLVAQLSNHPALRAGSGAAWMAYYVPVVGLSLLTLFVVLIRLNRNILVPVMRLIEAADQALGQEARRGPEPDPVAIHGLAAAVEGLRAEKDQWRERAADLKLHVERRVDSRTRHMARALRTAFRDAATDPLTALGNRRTLEEHFPALYEQARRLRADLTVVLLDIDSFKNINDRLGHAVGDEVLQFVGRLLAGCLRDEDVAIRLGGDEFLLLLPGVRADRAINIVQRITALFRQHGSTYDVEPPLTLSAGIVSLPDASTDDPAQLLDCADRALYAAKAHGRDTIRVFSSSMACQPAGR